MTHFWRGAWDEAMSDFGEAVPMEPGGAYAGWDQGHRFLGRAYIEHRIEDSDFEKLKQILPQRGRPSGAGSWIALLTMVEGLAVLGRRGEAARLYPLVTQKLEDGTVLCLVQGLVDKAAGIAAAAGEEWTLAEAHFEKALRLAEELPHRLEQPEVRRWYARMLLDREGSGDEQRARKMLIEAKAIYEELGMPKHVEMAKRS